MATKRVSVKREDGSFFFFSSIFLISFNSTVRRKRLVEPRDRPGSRSETTLSGNRHSQISGVDGLLSVVMMYPVHWSRDQQWCSPITLVIPASCPSTLPQPPRESGRSCQFLVKISISAYSRSFPGIRPGNQPMQHKKLYAATGQHEAQASSANSHLPNSRGQHLLNYYLR